MKRNELLKSIAAIALFIVAGMSAFAQITAPSGFTSLVAPTGNDATDSVTIGSVMPYRVSGDPQMHQLRQLGILDFSQYTKTISAGGTLRAATGIAASTPAATDSAFSVLWGTLGAQTVTVREVPVVVSGPAFTCVANDQVLPVVVLARPTIAWNGAASASGCGVDGTTVTIPYTAAGTGQFNVTYRIVYTNLSGTVTTPVNTGTVINALGAFTNGSQNFNFSYAVPVNAFGRYDVYVEAVSDRISRKSGVASQAADIPAVATTFYAYPTPVTQPINHIQNL